MTILTFHEAAQFLRISETHLRRIVKRTDIPRRQTGRKARIFFVQERLISWWDRASTPTPISVRTDTFKLLRRVRHGGVVRPNTMRPTHLPPDTKTPDTGSNFHLTGPETEKRGRPLQRSPEHLPRSWQE